MAAKEGVFDEVEGHVEATFQALVLGGNQGCVRGTDVLGNGATPPASSSW